MADQVLTQFVSDYSAALSTAKQTCQSASFYIFYCAAVIELAWLGLELSLGQATIKDFMRFIMKSCAVYWAIQKWDTLMEILLNTTDWFGKLVGAGGGTSFIKQPSIIIDLAYNTVSPLMNNSSKWLATILTFGMVDIVIVVIFGIVLWRFAVFAREMFIVVVVFYTVSIFGVVLLPFIMVSWLERFVPYIPHSVMKGAVYMWVSVLLLGLSWKFIMKASEPTKGVADLQAWSTYCVTLYVITDLYPKVRDYTFSMLYGNMNNVQI